MSYLEHLKKIKMHYSKRFLVVYDENDLVSRIRSIPEPAKYRKKNNIKKLNTQEGLIKILENDKRKRDTTLLQRQAWLYG